MKPAIYPLFVLLFSMSFLLSAQYRIKNIFFNSPDNILQLNFTDSTHVITYTNIKSGTSMGNSEAIAHAENKNGDQLFFVNAGKVYDRNGILMPGSAGLLADPSCTEIVVCPVPSDSLRYYIIYNEQLCSRLYFSTVNMKLRQGLGDVESVNTLIDPATNFAEGLEIVRIPCTPDFWLLAYQCNKGFVRCRISQKGIGACTAISPYASSNNGGRGELEYHHGKLGYAVTFSNKAFFGDFDPDSGTLTNTQEVTFPSINGMYGLEFSYDASKAYLTDWDNRDITGSFSGPNLFRYDFKTFLISFYTIPNRGALCGSTDVRGLGQIELASDRKLYVPHVGGCQITVIANADSTKPVFSTLDVNTILSAGVSDAIQSDIFKTITVSGNKEICQGDSVLLKVNGGSNHHWIPSASFSDPVSSSTYARPQSNTSYVVFFQNEDGCNDARDVFVTVNAKPAVELGNDTAVCASMVLKAGQDKYQHRWSDGSTTPSISAFPGVYWVDVYNKTCKVSDTIVIQKLNPVEVYVPNLLTMNGDGKNETFELKGYSTQTELSIFNRWGSQVFHSYNYSGHWAGKGLPSGIYYYFVNDRTGCVKENIGWIEILE